MNRNLHGNDMIIQSNHLVEAIYDSDLSATEHKILRYAASKIKQNPEDFPKVSFNVTEFIVAAGLKGNAYHAKVVKIADELTRKRIKIQSDDKTGWFPWLSALVYENGMIHLSFNTLIKDMLLELDGQFTRYSYAYIGDMQSGYTIRLFELLKQYAPIGKRRIDLDVLRRLLGISDKYAQYGQFKLRVLNQAKKEMDKKKELTFEFEEIKLGRKVIAIMFYIKVTNPKILLTNINATPNQVSLFVKEAAYLLESYNIVIEDKVIQSWSKYGIEALVQALNEVKHREMKVPSAYITKVLKSIHEEKEALVRSITSANKQVKEHIAGFIMSQKSSANDIQPDWFVENKFREFMNVFYAKTEIEEMWLENAEDIVKLVNHIDPTH